MLDSGNWSVEEATLFQQKVLSYDFTKQNASIADFSRGLSPVFTRTIHALSQRFRERVSLPLGRSFEMAERDAMGEIPLGTLHDIANRHNLTVKFIKDFTHHTQMNHRIHSLYIKLPQQQLTLVRPSVPSNNDLAVVRELWERGVILKAIVKVGDVVTEISEDEFVIRYRKVS